MVGAALYASYMEAKSGQKRPKSPGGTGQELRVVRVDCNPGPDAEDRLRRLFTLLVKYAARDRLLRKIMPRRKPDVRVAQR